MKKIYFIVMGIMLFVCPSKMHAQLTVDSVGNVAIPSKLEIAGNLDLGLNVRRSGSTGLDFNWVYGTNSITILDYTNLNIGVSGIAYSSTELDMGRSWGVRGAAGNSTDGYNYGVAGSLRGSQYGAGILGTTGSSESLYVPGQYAGYFLGNVKVTGNLTASTITTSDKRLKKNIESLGEKNVLESVLLLNPVVYNLKQQYLNSEANADTVSQIKMYEENSQLFVKKHYGLVAQELQEIYPDLVYEDATGYLSVDYTGLIPILIETIKELNDKVESLQTASASINQKSPKILSDISKDVDYESELYQNAPNPFTESTQIKFSLPSTIQKAYIIIYDLQGKQIKNYLIPQRGIGTHVISGSEFSPGIYLYGLIADGKEIGVNRMILTE